MMSRFGVNSPMRSELADDGEMRELIEFYLDELKRKVETIQSCLAGDDARGIETVAHQLKGSSVGYGYPRIGEAAGDLESALRSGSRESARELTERLLGLCARALMD